MKSNKNFGIITLLAVLVLAFVLAIILQPLTSKENTSSNQVNEGPTFVNTVWMGKTISGNPLVSGTSIQFETNGRVSGFNGCNNFSSTYTLNGSEIKIDSMASKLQACSEDAMKQADEFTKLLLATNSYSLDGIMTLNQNGTAGLTFTGSTNSLAKTSWDVTGYNNGKEAVVSPIIDTKPTIVFGDDGTISGSAGCNTYSGTYTLDGQSISIGTLATTRRMCIEPEGIMEQESSFLIYLEKADTWLIQGNMLYLRTPEDQLAVTAVGSSISN